MDFKHIIGHEDIIKHFKASIESGRISHAYIICGEEDSGKKSLANAFVKTLECEEGGLEPCNSCKACIQVESGSHPDVVTVLHSSARTIGVNEVREQLINDIEIKPYSGRYKIYIVPDAQLLTNEAQNALLKTIEEPPEYAVIILLATTVEKFLPTVISRCMVLNLRPVKDEDIKDYLMSHFQIDSKRAEMCACYAAGNLGKAVKLATNDRYQELVASVVRLEREILASGADADFEDIEDAIRDSVNYQVSINEYLDLMMVWYRDILMLKVSGPEKVIFKEYLSDLTRQSEVLSFNALEKKKKAINDAKRRIKANAKLESIMNLLIMTLKER